MVHNPIEQLITLSHTPIQHIPPDFIIANETTMLTQPIITHVDWHWVNYVTDTCYNVTNLG